MLSDTIKSIVETGYNNEIDGSSLTEALQKEYRSAFNVDPRSCGDELVPASSRYLADRPIELTSYGLNIKYRWLNPTKSNPHPEFAGRIESDASLNIGDVIDRFGNEWGLYASPVPRLRGIYTVTERSIPYWFIAGGNEYEPSYHRYRVIKPINYNSIKSAIETSDKIDESERRTLKRQVKNQSILYGDVAGVDAFKPQGDGMGKQYYLCISVHYLKQLEFLEDD